MTRSIVFIPFDRELYEDLVRFSDGSMNVPAFAEEQIMDFLERNIGGANVNFFGSRTLDFYRKYFPDYAEEIEKEALKAEALELEEILWKPLVWKEVKVKSGTKVRMQYGGTHHFATVKDGKIEDESGRYSPSQWAGKIANGTSRNAWRDIEFKEEGSTHWTLAEILRSKVRREGIGG